METLGVSCWDFAYADGKCCLTAGKNCFMTDSQPLKPRAGLKLKAPESSIEKKFAVTSISQNDDDDNQTTPPANSHHSHHCHSHRKKKSSRGHGHASTEIATRTYLLSSPTASSISYPQTRTTISTMLMTPHTQLIFLVPQSHILCSKVCEFSRLPRAGGSGMQVLPVAPPCAMACSGTGGNGCEKADAEKKGIDEIVKKLHKYTKARAFDGYLAFEDDRANWMFLEQVGKSLKGMAKKER